LPRDASDNERFLLLERSRAILADYRFAADPVETLCLTGSAYRTRAENHLLCLHRALDDDEARFEDAIEAFVEMTLDVMRMQDRYYRTGKFNDGPDVADGGSLYEDRELMGRRYLFGLYLAQIFWPNHLEKLQYFEDHLLPGATNGMRVLEVGTGPGTYGLAIGRAVECSELVLNDISPLSIDMVRRMAAVHPLRRPEALQTSTVDFLELDTTAIEPFDVVLFSEVLEHLGDPALGLDRLKQLLAPDAVAFFSTATNAAFYDHTVVFHSIEEIEDLLHRHGFEILTSSSILAVSGPDGRDVVDYVAIMRPVRGS
jgi:2-polyprenyl-3-methyl-5-hydroxy-6-metoxy-1,4-benzoquinol methylase